MSSDIKRTSAGLAEAMFRELENLEQGKSTPQAARAKSSVANTIISLSRLQMDYARFVADARSSAGEASELPDLGMGVIAKK